MGYHLGLLDQKSQESGQRSSYKNTRIGGGVGGEEKWKGERKGKGETWQIPHSNTQAKYLQCFQACSGARGLRNNSIFMSLWKRGNGGFIGLSRVMIPCSLNAAVFSSKGNTIASPFRQEQIQPFKLFDPAGLERIWQSPREPEEQGFKSVQP